VALVGLDKDKVSKASPLGSEWAFLFPRRKSR
jgi:hypothetical protein